MAGVLGCSWPIPLFCPLARSPPFAQPPQGAEMFRDRITVSRPASPDRRNRESRRCFLIADSIRWLSGMGVSSRCKRPVSWDKREESLAQTRPREQAPQPPFRTLGSPPAERDQALALLSTARSERSA